MAVSGMDAQSITIPQNQTRNIGHGKFPTTKKRQENIKRFGERRVDSHKNMGTLNTKENELLY